MGIVTGWQRGEHNMLILCVVVGLLGCVSAQAADTIAAVGEIAVDTVTIYRDIIAFGQEVSTDARDFLARTDLPPNLLNETVRDQLRDDLIDNDGLLTYVTAELKNILDKYARMLGNLCQIDAIASFTDSWPTWLDWVNPCLFDENRLKSILNRVESGVEWIDLNFQLIDMAFDLWPGLNVAAE